MAELSPQAQAVLDTFTEDNSLHDWKHNHYNVDALAAALRAAADQLFKTEVLPPGYAYSAPAEAWHYEFRLKAHRKLCAIAAELKALPND